MRDNDEQPFLDLHPSEWERKEHRQPFWGPNAKHVLILFVLSFPIGAIATWIVTGEFPYWLQPLLE